MVIWDPPGEQTDTTENIVFKQFRWRAVIIIISADKIDAQNILRIDDVKR